MTANGALKFSAIGDFSLTNMTLGAPRVLICLSTSGKQPIRRPCRPSRVWHMPCFVHLFYAPGSGRAASERFALPRI
jgi:hypothetical protein